MDGLQYPIPGAIPDPAAACGLIGCWILDEGTGFRVHDVSGHGIHGDLQNMEAADWGVSDDGAYLAFGGSDEYANVSGTSAAIQQISDAITCLARVRVGNLSGNNGLIARYTTSGNQRCFRLILDINERMGGYFSSNGTAYGTWPTSASAISQNAWHTLAWVKFPGVGTARNYIDGVLDNEGTISDGITSIYPSASAPLTIGMGYNTTGEPFMGDIAWIQIWNRAFSGPEIQAHTAAPHAFLDDSAWAIPWPSPAAGDTLTITRAVALSGSETLTVSRSLSLLGAEAASIARALAVMGSDPQSIARSAELAGLDESTLSRALALSGADAQTISRAASLIGADPQTVARGLATLGSEGQTIMRALALLGSLEATISRAAELSGAESASIGRALASIGSEASAISRACELWGVIEGTETASAGIAAYAYDAMIVARSIAVSAAQALTVSRPLSIWASAPTSVARAAQLWGLGAAVTRTRPATARILTSGYTIRRAG